MWGLALLALVGFYSGWSLLSFSLYFATKQWWLPFVVLVFFALVLLGLAWRAAYYAALVMLKISTSRLAVRDFKNSLADWLFSARTGWKE